MLLPVRIPEKVSITAIEVSLLNQWPPLDISVRLMVVPLHAVKTPAIGPGNGFTVIAFVADAQPGIVYFIVSMPGLIPVTAPVAFTVAITGSRLLHEPPGLSSVSVNVLPAHTLDIGPVIAPGGLLTVTMVVAKQPVPVYLKAMVTVPARWPVTIPLDEPTDAMLMFELVHVPGELTSLNVVVPDVHIPVEPDMGAGFGFTVIALLV